MKNRKRTRMLATGLLFGLVAMTAHAVERQESVVRFYEDDVTITRMGAGDRVQVSGCHLQNETRGLPDLPSRLYRLALPIESEVVGVEVIEARWVKMDGGPFNIRPATGPLPTSHSPDLPALERNQAVYGSKDVYPISPVEFASEGISSDYHIGTFIVHPLRYHPLSGRMERLEELRFAVLLESLTPNETPAVRRSELSALAVDRAMERLVDNPEDLDRFAPSTAVEQPGKARGPEPLRTRDWPSLEGLTVDYVIVTTEELAPSFEPLRQARMEAGMNTVIKLVSEIVPNYHGVDDQERIRNFLIDCYNHWGTRYVLLGGDVNHVPDRKGFFETASQTWGPSDLYYATVTGNWNYDGDDQFGESPLDDDDADMAVGRAPAENAAEADLFVQKVLNYGDGVPAGFAEKLLLMGATYACRDNPALNNHWGQECKEEVTGIVTDVVPQADIWRMYNLISDVDLEDPNAPDPEWVADELLIRSNALNRLNNESFNIINHCDHSFVHTMGTGIYCGGHSLDSSHIRGLNNGQNQGIVFTVSCWHNAFDHASISEEWLNNPNGGAAALIGCSRDGSTSQVAQDIAFYESVYTNGTRMLGDAFNDAREGMHYSIYRRWLNMLGDPTMRIWTRDANLLGTQHAQKLSVGTHNLAFTVWEYTSMPPWPTVEGARVCLYREGEVFATALTDASGVANLSFTVDTPGAVTVTITAEDRLDYKSSIRFYATKTAHLYVDSLRINDDDVAPSDGNGNGVPEAGETLEFEFVIANSGSTGAKSVTCDLSALMPDVSIITGQLVVREIPANSSITVGPFVAEILPQFTEDEEACFRLDMSPANTVNDFEDQFCLFVEGPEVAINDSTIVDDGSGQSQGDNDGLPEPGETVEIYFELGNSSPNLARDLRGVPTTREPGLTIPPGEVVFGDVPPMGNVVGEPVVLEIDPSFTGDLRLVLEMTDAYGPYGNWAIDLVTPEAPTGLEFQPEDDSIRLSWNPVDSRYLRGYHVYRSPNENGPFERITTLAQRGSSLYFDSNLLALPNPVGEYYYYVTTVDRWGNESEPSDTILAWPNYPRYGGWPIRVGGRMRASAAVADVDGDGFMEIFGAGKNGVVYGFRHDGTEMFDIDNDPETLSGFAITEGALWGAVSLADLDGDGSLEVLCTSRGSEEKLYAWRTVDNNADGKPDPFWGPDHLEFDYAKSLSAPAIADVDRDGYLEIAFSTQNGGGLVHLIDARGFEEAGWPQGGLGDYTYATPALGDIDRDGDLEIVIGGKYGHLRVWHHVNPGSGGLDVDLGAGIDSSVALGDVNGDGHLDIVQNTNDGKVHVLDYTGQPLVGWTNVTYDIANGADLSSPALADVDGDYRAEIFLVQRDGFIGFDDDGTELTGFPIDFGTTDRYLNSSLAVADIDGDLVKDLIGGFIDEKLHAYDSTGQPLKHWPAMVGTSPMGTPTIADIDGDRDLEVIMTAGYQLHVIDLKQAVFSRSIPWGTFHANVRRDGVLHIR